jgi:predicted nucleic acid-binding protein
VARFAVDTSCIVAAVCSWHERHAEAAADINRRLEHGERLCTPAPALVEAYAVLTRLPPPHRLSAADAWALLDSNFIADDVVVTLTAARYVEIVKRAARLEVAGGRTYDMVIGECARDAAADVLLTFNRRHFDPAPAGVTVVEPGTS